MKILLTGLSVRAMAESAVRSEYSVIALDAFGDLDLQRLCESYAVTRDFGLPYSPAALLTASERLSFEAVAYTSNLENYPGVVGRFERQRLLLGNPPEVLRRVRNWKALYGALAEGGFPTPATILSGNGRRPDPEHRWLVKPRRGGGGRQVGFWNSPDLPGSGFMLQQYLPGRALSASFVANGKEAVVLGLTEQLIGCPEFGASGFHYCGNLLPPTFRTNSGEAQAVVQQVRDIANLLTRQFGLVGVNGMDFILVEGQVWLTEVNPRYSASMELIEQAYGLPVFDLHVRSIRLGELPKFDLLQPAPDKANWPGGPFCGKAILYAEAEGQAPDTYEWLARGIKDVPHPGDPLAAGKPICTVLAQGATSEDCLNRLVTEAAALKGEIYA